MPTVEDPPRPFMHLPNFVKAEEKGAKYYPRPFAMTADTTYIDMWCDLVPRANPPVHYAPVPYYAPAPFADETGVMSSAKAAHAPKPHSERTTTYGR